MTLTIFASGLSEFGSAVRFQQDVRIVWKEAYGGMGGHDLRDGDLLGFLHAFPAVGFLLATLGMKEGERERA